MTQAVIFTGIQATGKTSFYLDRFFRTHVHIHLDRLKRRSRERAFLQTCLATLQPFVVDNTNVTAAERAVYIQAAREHGFTVIGYYFQSVLEDALKRNAQRPAAERIPDAGVGGMAKRLEIPAYGEGFEALYYVRLVPGGFEVADWLTTDSAVGDDGGDDAGDDQHAEAKLNQHGGEDDL